MTHKSAEGGPTIKAQAGKTVSDLDFRMGGAQGIRTPDFLLANELNIVAEVLSG